MQHKAFQCAPQSILASPTFATQFHDHSSLSPRSRKRLRKPASKAASQTAPLHSSSSSSWGVADPSEDVETTSESDDDNDQGHDPSIAAALQNPESTRNRNAPVKKRRHLGPDDVGRFADMSIDRDPVTLFPSSISWPSAPPRASSPLPLDLSSGLKEVQATAVEEPEEQDDDIAMQARRGPTIHQLDDNRFYVTSLSDDSSDEEAEVERADQANVDAILQEGSIEQQNDSHFVVNGELIHRLQAIESQKIRALHRDQAFVRRRNRNKHSDESGSSTPTTRASEQGALILWKKPEHLRLDFGASTAPHFPSSNSSPPVVLEEGDYAYVHRPSVPSPFRASHSTQSKELDDTMDIDN